MFNRLFWSIFTVHFNNCIPFVRQTINSTGEEMPVLRGYPRFDIGHQLIQILIDFAHLPVFQRAVNVVVRGGLCGRVGRMR